MAAAPIAADAPTLPRTILLVEDDSFSAAGMQRLLELDGVEVTVAASGEEALAALAGRAAPELVLLDIGLPNMDGYEVCRRMRGMAIEPKLLIFALTGFGQDSDREATRQAGFDEHLTKPVDIDDVYALYARRAKAAARA